MQITHEEAHRLIQFNADDALNTQEKSMLSAHLEGCAACRTYAEQIEELESILLPVMKRQWNLQPIPLLPGAVYAKRNVKIQANIILATRRMATGIVFLALLFGAWQFSLSGGHKSSQVPVSIPPVPTPSAQSTRTTIASQNCAEILYRIQENDTLEGIAHQFAVSQEEIMAANNMETDTVNAGMKLTIPICKFTPTGTVHPTIYSTRYTPFTSPATSTPGG